MAEPASSPSPSVITLIDCGTSSVRATIAEIAGVSQRVLEDLRYPVDLTAAFTGGKLSRAAMDAVAEAIAGIVASARAYGGTRFRAVATTGLREAANADALIERIRVAWGIELDVIDAAEEARLYFEALRVLLARTGSPVAGDFLMIEIGGGGSCISLVRGGKLVHSVDEHFGTHRVHRQFRGMRDSLDYATSIDRYAQGAARMLLSRLPQGAVERLVLTGGVVRRLLALCQGDPESLQRDAWELETLAAERVAAWWERIAELTPAARATACACDEHDAAVLLPAAALIRHLCAETGVASSLVPNLTLRDGLLADLLPGAAGPHHCDDQILRAEARQLLARYGCDPAYAENTASLALQIFDQTRALHGLDARSRTLLEFSSLVHDIGSFINVRNRHKHAMYLIQATDIVGLTLAEKNVVAQVARYHRKSPPEPHHTAFTALSRSDRVLVSSLAGMLRLAYALDVERSQRIRSLRCEVRGERLLIHLDRRQVALERWSLAGKADLFEELTGLSVQIVPREER